jgi:hypothetical protein
MAKRTLQIDVVNILEQFGMQNNYRWPNLPFLHHKSKLRGFNIRWCIHPQRQRTRQCQCIEYHACF